MLELHHIYNAPLLVLISGEAFAGHVEGRGGDQGQRREWGWGSCLGVGHVWCVSL